VRYGGPATVVTGTTALALYGFAVPKDADDGVLVLVPHTSQRSSHGFVTVRRTRRVPQARSIRGIPVASVARALVDACRELRSLDAVRGLVATVIQRGGCTIAELARELYAAPRQRTALPRAVLSEVQAGVRSVAEAKAREILGMGGVPQPLWNAEVRTLDGDLIAEPDGLWEDVLAALELDSMTWHLSPASYLRTQRRQRRLLAAGILVLPVGPGDILDDPDRFLAEVRAFRRAAADRPLPAVHVVPRGLAA
jgi:hypothetical protein